MLVYCWRNQWSLISQSLLCFKDFLGDISCYRKLWTLTTLGQRATALQQELVCDRFWTCWFNIPWFEHCQEEQGCKEDYKHWTVSSVLFCSNENKSSREVNTFDGVSGSFNGWFNERLHLLATSKCCWNSWLAERQKGKDFLLKIAEVCLACYSGWMRT